MSDDTKILIVDDDAFTRALFAVALGERYDLLEAESGHDALLQSRQSLNVCAKLRAIAAPVSTPAAQGARP